MPSRKCKAACGQNSGSQSESQVDDCCGKKSRDCGSCDGEQTSQRWVEHCPPGACPPPCKGMKPWEIDQKFRDAVVRITAQTSLTTSHNPADRLAPVGVLTYQTNFATLFVHGNGFFTNRHIIVAPAQLALLPPNTSTVFNRYPFTTDAISPTADASTILRADRFIADVFNVNGSGHTFTYQLQLLGVDAAGDIAIFYINPNLPFNCGLPCIKKCHPYLKFGCSRKYRRTLPVYSFGDPFARSLNLLPNPALNELPGLANTFSQLNNPAAANVFLQGVVQENRFIDYAGYAPQELVAVSFEVFDFKLGLPMVDWYGKVIGMQTLAVAGAAPYFSIATAGVIGDVYHPIGDGFVAGPSSFFMVRSIKHLYRALCGKSSDFVTTVTDSFGNYYRYIHGYLGASTVVFTGQNYLSFWDASGYTEVRYLADGISYQTGPAKKEVIGLVIRALAGQTGPGSVVVPGTTTAGSTGFVDSPLAAANIGATYNDVLTHAMCCALGGQGKQIPLSLVTWRLQSGDVLNLGLRRSAEDYANVYGISVNLIDFPAYMDFPWAGYHNLAALLGDLTPPLAIPNGFSDPMPVIGGRELVPAI